MQAPLTDQPTQRWGLVLGFVLCGALWGLSFGLVAYGIQTLRPAAWTTARLGFTLALLLGWSVAMLPFLKYPANPPGVGETATSAYRQGLYLGFLGLSAVGTVAAVGLRHWLKQSAQLASTGRTHAAMAVAVYAIYVPVVYLAMPANPDPVEMPPELVWLFRAVAFLGLILFWAVLGGAFVWLLRDASTPSPVRRRLE
jgi:Probable cobalt transporter subunit (CbtA)